jgi:hypothetical protein
MQELKRSDSKFKAVIKKNPLIGWLYRQWSFRSSARSSLAWHHTDRYPKDNKSTTPPTTEKIELHCVWVTEVFTPSKVNDLISALKKLGWDEEEKSISTDKNLIEWVKQSRSHAGGGSWINGGIIQSPNDRPRFYGDSKKTSLPAGVDFGRFCLMNITSSVTLATIQFVLKDESAHSLNEPFNRSYKTTTEYWPSGFNCKKIYYIDVQKQKRKAIKEQLNLIHGSIYDWFNQNLPGYYSSSSMALPTVDLITSTEFEPPKQDRGDHYSDLLFDYNYERWPCKDISNLELRLPWEFGSKPVSILFGNFGKLTADTEAYGGKDRAALTSKLDMSLNQTIGLWAMHDLLLNYERQLLEIRDRVLSPVKNTSRALKDLNYIRNQFLSIATDIQSASFDVAGLTKNKGRYSHDHADFSAPDFYSGKMPDFLELLREQDALRSETLRQLEVQVSASINADGNLTSAIANLHVQRSMVWLTIFIGVLTIVPTIISIYSKNPSLNELLQKMDYLIELIKTHLAGS